MATTLRQMLIASGANVGTVTLVIQKGVGTWPMPGSPRLDTPYGTALTNTGGVVVPNTDPLWDKRINSQFDMPRAVGFDTGIVYYPICISQHEPYFHPIYTASTGYTSAGSNQPVHIVTDIGFQPWRAYQGVIQGRLNGTFPQ